MEAPTPFSKIYPRGQLDLQAGARASPTSPNGARPRAHYARAHSLPGTAGRTQTTRTMERARACIMRVRIAYRAQHGRGSCCHLNAQGRPTAGRWPLAGEPAGHLPAGAAQDPAALAAESPPRAGQPDTSTQPSSRHRDTRPGHQSAAVEGARRAQLALLTSKGKGAGRAGSCTGHRAADRRPGP